MTPTGWQCPICRTVWSPTVRSCEKCPPHGPAGLPVGGLGISPGGGGGSTSATASTHFGGAGGTLT